MTLRRLPCTTLRKMVASFRRKSPSFSKTNVTTHCAYFQVPALRFLRITRTMKTIFPIPMKSYWAFVSNLFRSKATIPFLILTPPVTVQEMCSHPSEECGGSIAAPLGTESQAQAWEGHPSSEIPPPSIQEYSVYSDQDSPMWPGEPP
jgi:hypothetical protein